MISVEKGEIYWSIILDEDDEPCAIPYVNEGTHIDIGRLASKNSFNTREEAEVMVRKLRAVLNGADVIESLGNINICDIENNSDYEDGVSLGWQKCYNWIKSKIVK